MSSNGHVVEGATIATLEMLRAANTKLHVAKQSSERAGHEISVRIRTIRKARYFAMLPPRPAEADAWPNEPTEYSKHYEQWRNSLPDAERMARRALEDAVSLKVLEAGLVEPEYSTELAEILGDDADAIAIEILRFSGILSVEKTTEMPTEVTP